VYSTGVVVRADEELADGDETECESEEPARTKTCPTLAVGASCDDNDDETSFDTCASLEANSCAGKVQLAAAVTLPVDTTLIKADVLEELTADDVDTDTLNASPLATPIKSSLATALSVDTADITLTKLSTSERRRRLQAGLSVDYVVALPAAEAGAAQTASATMQVPDVVVPATATVAGAEITIAQADIVSQPLKSYAYVKTSLCPASPVCSNVCGTEAVNMNDAYTCEEDGAAVDTASCEPVLGTVPSTQTECCPAADEDFCEQSDEAITEPPCPPDYATNPDLTKSEKLECGLAELDEKTDGNAVLFVAVGLVIGVALLCLVYRLCCGDSDDDSGDTDVEKGEGGKDDERIANLEQRLAVVRDGIKGAGEGP